MGLITAGTAPTVRAELLPIRVYRSQDGLAHQNVRCIVQGSRGYLWMGTANGLSRFDGELFVNYGLEHGLPGAMISTLLEIEPGVLFLGTETGLFHFDARAANPTAVPVSRDPAATGSIFQLHRDAGGRIWAGAERGLFRLDREGATNTLTRVSVGFPADSSVRAILGSRDGSLWIGGPAGLRRRTPEGKIEDTNIKGFVRALEEDHLGRIWVGLNPGLVVHLPRSATPLDGSSDELPNQPGRSQPFSPSDEIAGRRIRVIKVAATGNIWIGAVGALYEYDGRRFRLYGEQHGLSDRTINTIATDTEGQMWLGSDLGGAMRWVREGLVSYTVADGLGHDSIDSVIPGDDGELFAWTGARAILSHLVGEQWSSHRLTLPPSLSETLLREPAKAMRDSKGQWWIATVRGLLHYASTDALLGGDPIAWYTESDGLANDHVYRAFENRQGDLWILAFTASEGTVTRWRRRDGTFERFTAGDGLPDAGRPIAWTEVSGQPFFGWSTGALIRFSEASGFQTIEVAPGKPIRDLRADRAGRLWIATDGAGLFLLDDPLSESPFWSRIGSRLPLDCRSLGEDQWGRIYVGTVDGAFRIEPDSGRVEALPAADKSTAAEINVSLTDDDGTLWFGSYGGLLRLTPLPPRPCPPPTTWISGVKVDGQPISVSGLGEFMVGPLDIPRHRGVIQIDFASLAFNFRRKPQYQFRLLGANVEWGPLTSERSVLLANLAAGNYRFEVRPAPQEGVKPAVVSFRIPPPFWQRTWFLGLLAVFTILTLAFIHKTRVRRLVEIEQVRTRIAADLHDDIGASLSRISLLSEVAKRGGAAGSGEALGQIGDIARDLSRRTREIVWSMNPRFDDLDSFVVRLRETAGEILDDRGVAWALEAPAPGKATYLRPEVRRHLLLVYRESLLNVARHANAEEVSLVVRLSAGKLHGEIRDDGIGFDLDRSVRGSGSGLRNIGARIAELGGRFEVSSSEAGGTAIRFELAM